MTTEMKMNTREIAELTGKRHAHVIRDCRNMFEALELAEPKFESGYFDSNNQERLMYELPKDLSLTLVSGYDVVLRNHIINRWIELEESLAGRTLTQADLLQQLGAEIQRVQTIADEHAVEAMPITYWVGRRNAPESQVYLEKTGYIVKNIIGGAQHGWKLSQRGLEEGIGTHVNGSMSRQQTIRYRKSILEILPKEFHLEK